MNMLSLTLSAQAYNSTYCRSTDCIYTNAAPAYTVALYVAMATGRWKAAATKCPVGGVTELSGRSVLSVLFSVTDVVNHPHIGNTRESFSDPQRHVSCS